MANPPVRDPKRWEQIEQVFNEALDYDPANRSAFLERACGTDNELRREVESLLASLEQSAPFIESAIEDAASVYLKTGAQPELSSGSMLAQYRIVRLLGSGGMGQIYLASDTRLKRNVALKLLPGYARENTTLLRRFEQEARILSSLNHPNLLTIFDFCTVDNYSFLVTELVEGESLRDKLRGGGLPVETAIDIAWQIASALRAAHSAGVIHRDIKPENIMVRGDGCVKVLDFGIAKLDDALKADGYLTITASRTEPGALLGTPRYMSPEQARGLSPDARGDLFSLGAVFYEMITGKPAFAGNSYGDLIADILRGEPAPIDFPKRARKRALQPILDRCLAKDPAKRYESAESLIADLDRLRHAPRPSTHTRQVRVLQFALVLAIVLIIALTAHHLHRPVARPAPRSLAVLPFRNLRPSAETDFLSFALADQVIGKLGYVKALIIRPASSVVQYREGGADSEDLRKVAARLKAQLLLTGTYVKDGQQLQITARLLSFSPDVVIWQNSMTVPYGNLLSVQDRVADMIIGGLSLKLDPDEKELLKPESPVNSLAYEYYLRGVDLYAVSDFGGAIRMLEKSASIDPKYAPTWAHLGRAYTTNASLQFGGRREYRLAEQAYDNAMSLNPTLPEPRVYMANLLTDTGRVEQAVNLLRVALQSSPNNAEAHWELGYAYRFGGMLEQSVAECELARRLDPEVKINSSALNTYLYLGDYDKFLRSLPPNDSAYLVFYHGLGEYYKHDYANARADFDRAFDLAPGLFPAQIGKGLSEGLKHRSSAGLSRLHETERDVTAAGVTDPEGLYKLAQAYAQLGDPDDAIRLLEESVRGGFFCYPYISRDPLLVSLHGESRFEQVLEKTKERWQQFRQRFSESF